MTTPINLPSITIRQTRDCLRCTTKPLGTYHGPRGFPLSVERRSTPRLPTPLWVVRRCRAADHRRNREVGQGDHVRRHQGGLTAPGRSRPRWPAPLVERGAVFAHLLALRHRRVALAG